jgi:hypothetical protein
VSITQGVRVFISYSSKDGQFADRLVRVLSEFEMVPFAFKRTRIPPATNYVQHLRYAINQCHFFVVLLSENHSSFIDNEIGQALGQGKIIVPVLLSETAQLPTTLSQTQAICAFEDLDNWIFEVAGYIRETVENLIVSIRATAEEAKTDGALTRTTAAVRTVNDAPVTKWLAGAAGLMATLAVGWSAWQEKKDQK